MTIGLRSERITLTDGGEVNVLLATIRRCSCIGDRFEYQLAFDKLELHAGSAVRYEGAEIDLLIRPEDCLLYPTTAGGRNGNRQA